MTSQLSWTAWAPIVDAVAQAPRTAGVYQVRSGDQIVYIGSAGHRRNGVAARLTAYRRGKSPDSGLAGHASSRALADPMFCQGITDAAEAGTPATVSTIAVRALDHLHLNIRSAATDDFTAIESQLIAEHRSTLWNIR
jgi:hypothetical protein